MSKDFDLWPADDGPYVGYDPDAAVPPPRPSNPFDTIAPRHLFAAGVTPQCFLCWQSDVVRDRVRWLIGHALAEALDELFRTGRLVGEQKHEQEPDQG